MNELIFFLCILSRKHFLLEIIVFIYTFTLVKVTTTFKKIFQHLKLHIINIKSFIHDKNN